MRVGLGVHAMEVAAENVGMSENSIIAEEVGVRCRKLFLNDPVLFEHMAMIPGYA